MAIDSKNGAVIYRNIGLGDIARYRLPWAGKVSILHRASGALMFLLLPFVLYLFEQSLTSEISFAKFTALLSNGFAKVVVLALIWAYLHHFCAGIRYLILDLHIGID
ncbi:succinate dehydrogenase, cytochrome b556 subunit, partial [Ralstonia pickettii]